MAPIRPGTTKLRNDLFNPVGPWLPLLCAQYQDLPLGKMDLLMLRQKIIRRPTVSTITPLSFDYFG